MERGHPVRQCAQRTLISFGINKQRLNAPNASAFSRYALNAERDVRAPLAY
jgi:hypothetical protein